MQYPPTSTAGGTNTAYGTTGWQNPMNSVVQNYINQANAYSQKVVPIAEGQAARILKEADAYREQVILQAKADTTRYLAILPQYERAPKVTRERLYLDTIESVLQNSSKILIDTKSASMMYLPLDKIFAKQLKPVTLPKEFAKPIPAKPKQNQINNRPNRVGYSNAEEGY